MPGCICSTDFMAVSGELTSAQAPVADAAAAGRHPVTALAFCNANWICRMAKIIELIDPGSRGFCAGS